ncbi:hypothetical protein BGLA2_3030006 [Burkholderia gladioli]|nr:hypothetical protein BGLA2_3030006 [Burkholderia gladioli]
MNGTEVHKDAGGLSPSGELLALSCSEC